MSQSSIRTLDQEPDTIALFPDDDKYMIVGTYSLVRKSSSTEDVETSESGSDRVGSLQILSVIDASQTADSPSLVLSRLDFPFGIYDIHFHPDYSNLLGVATSNAEILFFRISTTRKAPGHHPEFRIIEVGKALIEDPYDYDERIAIITQFHFIQLPNRRVSTSEFASPMTTLLATTQFGNTKLVQVLMSPFLEDGEDSAVMTFQDTTIHKQSLDLEAWTVLSVFATPSQLYVLSGGDDSQMFISKVDLTEAYSFKDLPDLNFDRVTITQQIVDRRTHEAGVVHVCSLGSKSPTTNLSIGPNDHLRHENEYLILTGSYDENLRLFLFSPSLPKTRLSHLAEINLEGGVWRILPLDTYQTSHGVDYILLIAAHTSGACIVRLSCRNLNNEHEEYIFAVEKWLKEGHESLVYAVAAKKVEGGEGVWDLVSASFYDKRVCTWRWIDERRMDIKTRSMGIE